jgi:hypothetical protein
MSAFEASSTTPSADAENPTKKLKIQSPKDAYFERLSAVIDQQKGKGYILVEGISRSDGKGDEEDEDAEDLKVYTEEQISQLRIIVITDSREKCLKKAANFVTCGQAGDCVMMFNTQSGNDVICGMPAEIAKAMKKKKMSERFDNLFALTDKLKEYDMWMNDNELYGEGTELDDAIKKLGQEKY